MRICLYGAASNNIDDSYIKAVETLGQKMAERGHSLIYGGGAGGLMGAVARGMYQKGGEIVGVAPTFFNVDGVLFEHCTKLIGTETMRERKKIMEEGADAFIMAPGGVGTFDEFFEILTLKQLGRHNKALVVFNVNGYYCALEKMMQQAADKGFLNEETQKLYHVVDNADSVLDYIEHYSAQQVDIKKLRNIQEG